MQCGLLGEKLGHSFSPQIHSHFGDYSYILFEKSQDELESFLKSGDFSGLNVTIPYKKTVLAYCDELTDRAAMLGAVNTLVRRADGKLIGHNTDYFGFESQLLKSGIQVSGKRVLVLGSGGASVTAVAVLKQYGAEVVVVSRSGENNYSNLHWHADASVIVNATPVGMYPNVGKSPIDLALFPYLEGVLDIVYNPSKTKLILDAEARGLKTENGLWMLVAQAKESAEWFLNSPISHDRISQIHDILRRQMENLVLVGMPGCGKSTIGAQLAQRLNKKFIDVDVEITHAAGMQIPEIFATGGEETFRRLETQVLAKIGKESGLVIATGGGCVTRFDNYPLLHQNGRIIWIRRDLHTLATEGRPLSHKNRLEEMYEIRMPLYKRFADYSVINDGSVDQTIAQILTMEGYE